MKTPIRVLLVEDNRATCALLRGFFEQAHGTELCGEAHDGWEALEMLRQLEPDLMLLDLVMPGLDGIGLLEALRKTEKPAPKIIVHSGVGSDQFVQRACRLGASYYVMKPASLNELAVRIAALFPEEEETPSENGLGAWALLRMGARQDMQGFLFLNRCATLLAEDEDRQLKEVYLMVAKECATTYNCVEKNLRTSIRQIHEVQSEAYVDLFGAGGRQPTNGTFLHWLAGELGKEQK